MPSYQNEEVDSDPSLAADELMTRLEEVVTSARDRYNLTVEHHRGRTVALETAFESLRAVEETANWGDAGYRSKSSAATEN